MIWPFQILAVAVLIAAAFSADRKRDAECLMYSLVTLTIVQVWKGDFMNNDLRWFAFFIHWLTAASLVHLKGDANSRHIDTSALMLVGVSLCYFWGWVAGADFFNANAQHIVTEVLCALSWLIIGGQSLGIIGKRFIHSLGSRPRVGGLHRCVYRNQDAEKKRQSAVIYSAQLRRLL